MLLQSTWYSLHVATFSKQFVDWLSSNIIVSEFHLSSRQVFFVPNVATAASYKYVPRGRV